MRSAVVTGSNRGLGLAVAKKLAQAGFRVLLTSRDPVQGRTAVSEVRAAVPGAEVAVASLDLASRSSVEAFAAARLAEGAPVHLLMNNAGRMTTSKTPHLNDEGVELLFATNALGPLLLTRRLLPLLEKAEGARVVNTGSRSHLRVKPGELRFEDLDSQRTFHPMKAYGRSKLALMWWTLALARRLPPRRITLNAVCPGFVPATIVPATSGLMRLLMKHVMPLMPFAHTLEAGSAEIARVGLDPALEGLSGRFFAEGRELPPSEEARDQEKQERFWQLACERLGLPTEL